MENEPIRWFVAHTQALKEDAACEHLRRSGYQPFYQRVRVTAMQGGRKVAKVRPLMPRYIYVGATPDQGLYDANNAPGVSTVLHGPNGPYRVPAEVMERELAKVDESGFVPPPAAPERCSLRQGDELELLEGPLAGFPATFHALDNDRYARILVSVFGRLVEAAVPLTWVRAVSESSKKRRWNRPPRPDARKATSR